MNTTKQNTELKVNKSMPLRQWLYSALQLQDWSWEQRQMLLICLCGFLSGLFNGSLAFLELIVLGSKCDRFDYLFTRSKINWDVLLECYEKWVIHLMNDLSLITGLPIWGSFDDTSVQKDKRSKKIVKGAKRKNKEGFSFVTAVIGVGLFFLPLIPRQCFRKKVAEKEGMEYIPKTKVVENLIELCYGYGLKRHLFVILLDSWYTSNSMIKKCLELNLIMIGAIKSNRNLNGKAINMFRTGLRSNQRTEVKTEKYLFRLYLRNGILRGILKPVRVLLSQRISLSDKKKSWRYIVCIGLEAGAEEILSWYQKRWTVETFHQLWKGLFHPRNWRLQSISGIQNLATTTVIAMGLAVYIYIRRHDNKMILAELRLDHCVLAVASSEIKESLISNNNIFYFLNLPRVATKLRV